MQMSSESGVWDENDEMDPGTDDSNLDTNEKETVFCRWQNCDTEFSSLTSLVAHLNKHHARAGETGLFHCNWQGCTRNGKGFNARYKMLVHVRTHTNEKPHECPKCNKCFSRAENLKIHARSHTGERPYLCPVNGCNKAYSNSSDRFKHTRTHYIDKPYKCKVDGCNKRYTDPSSLRKHIKTYRHFPTSNTECLEPVTKIDPWGESVTEHLRKYLHQFVLPTKWLPEQDAPLDLSLSTSARV